MAPSWALESDSKSCGNSAVNLAAGRLAKLAGESEEIKDKSGFYSVELGNASTQNH
jgi:hypothetical protein